MILSPGMVTLIRGPETLHSLTLEFPSPQVLSPVDPRTLTLLGVGWCRWEAGRLAPALPISLSQGLFVNLLAAIIPWFRPIKKEEVVLFGLFLQ